MNMTDAHIDERTNRCVALWGKNYFTVYWWSSDTYFLWITLRYFMYRC